MPNGCGNYDLRSVKFFNEWTGIVVGQGGIWRSINSGVNWVQVLSGVNLNSVSFPDINTGYAVGDSGKIFKTSNGGINWNQIGIGFTAKNLNTVSFPSANTGWIMGQSGKILYTFNGGASFSNQTNGDTTYDINYLHMANATTGYYCGSSNANAETFGITANGGINWIYSFYMFGNVLNAVSNIPTINDNALAVGTNGRIRRTTTNGTTWTVITSPINVQLNHVVFLNVSTGYIAGNAGYILKTTNSGLNWFVEANVTSNNLKYLNFINATTAWVIGNNGIVIRTGIPVGVVYQENSTVTKFALQQNQPNPFNPITKICFEIPKSSFVELIVYDLLGNQAETLINKVMTAGKHEINFNGERFSSGLYIYKLQVNNDFLEYKKMILVK